MKFIVGIDVGNGEVKAAFCGPSGQPQVVRNDRGGKSWPSYVFKGSDGKVLIGDDAREQGLIYPDQVAVGWKMHLADGTKKYFGGTASGSDVVALMIQAILPQIEKQSGQKIDGVVFTCPANFTDAHKQGLLDGAKKAGLTDTHLITEPSAAAYAVVVKDRAGVGRTSFVGCADLGHGTFDVSILEVKDGTATPISTEGLPKHGGLDYTEIVVKLVLDKVDKELGKAISIEKLPPEQAYELREKAEKAKHALSGSQNATKVVLHFGGKARSIEILKTDYDAATTQLMKLQLECMDKALRATAKTYNDVESFVLAGGPSHSLRWQETFATHTGLVPNVQSDPSSVVSFGAALHGLNLAREAGGLGFLPDRPILQEATSHDIGVAVIDETSSGRETRCIVIVPKNTPIPCKHVEKFRLERANQPDVAIDILQGPNGENASKCSRIGGFVLRGLKPEAQRTARIELWFKFDSNSLVTVIATDLVSGTTQTVSVKINASLAA